MLQSTEHCTTFCDALAMRTRCATHFLLCIVVLCWKSGFVYRLQRDAAVQALESFVLLLMLPLCKGMPICLTDHLDRNPEKSLLRGKVGEIHSWQWHEQDVAEEYESTVVLKRLPVVEYVKFPGAKWKVPGISEPGVYPVVPVKRRWALDRNRQHPRLWIIRNQQPLAPAFAMTAHASQGQTLRAAIVDLNVSGDCTAQAGYVALSRVRRVNDLLIFRPFPHSLFTKQKVLGPDLLLRHLRGEKIDWQKLQARYSSKSGGGDCLQCHRRLLEEMPGQVCKDCVTRNDEQRQQQMAAHVDHGCTVCTKRKAWSEFPPSERGKKVRTCSECLQLPVCAECHKHAPELADGEQKFCNTCIQRHELQRRARMPPTLTRWRCKGKLARTQFSESQQQRAYRDHRTCLDCEQKHGPQHKS